MDANLQKLLDMPSNQIDRAPKALPTGWYIATVVGQPREGESTVQKTPFREFEMRIVDTYKDVDDDAMEEFLTLLDGSTRTLNEVTIANTYYLTPKALGRLAQFLDHLEGLKPGDTAKETASTSQRISETNGKTCLIHIRHEPWQSGEGVSARIDQTMIYED
jgi:hypothetical protein